MARPILLASIALTTLFGGSDALDQITSQALLHSRAYSFLEELSDHIGPRLTGSPEAAKATAWAVRTMQAIGLQSVHVEEWPLDRSWRRGSAHLELLAPFRSELNVASYGWVGSTERGAVDAPVIAVDADSIPEEIGNNEGAWKGKVLLLVAKGPKHISGAERAAQLGGLVEAAGRGGAIAVIARDRRPGTMLTHTGPVGFAGRFYQTPVLDIASEHQVLLERLLASGQEVRVRIQVENFVSNGPVASVNVVGELAGSSQPEEWVIAGAHLDSWDLGTGAIDDGFGVAAVLAAADAIVKSGAKPRRTIRFVLFTGEEQGLLGSRAYVRHHAAELRNLIAAFALDWGQGPITSLPLAGRRDLVRPFEEFAGLVSGLGPLKIDAGYMTFTDAYAFTLAGVPGIAPLQDSRDYTLFGHSAADTLDKVDSGVLARNSALLAAMLYWTAHYPARLGETWTAEKTEKVLTEDGQREVLEHFGLWPARTLP